LIQAVVTATIFHRRHRTKPADYYKVVTLRYKTTKSRINDRKNYAVETTDLDSTEGKTA
jgi:hypothetical protein